MIKLTAGVAILLGLVGLFIMQPFNTPLTTASSTQPQAHPRVDLHLHAEAFTSSQNLPQISNNKLNKNERETLTILRDAEQFINKSVAADIDVDGRVNLDGAGQLLVDRELRRLFDFYIGLIVNDYGIDELITLIKAHLIKAEIADEVQNSVFAILSNYLAYREAISRVPVADYSSDSLKATYNKIADYRLQYLGRETAEAFFAKEDARERYIIERQKIVRDDTLSQEQKTLQLQTVENLLPYNERQNRANIVKLINVREQVESIQNNGETHVSAKAEAVFQARAQSLGYEAAERLAKLDEQREHWQQRVNQYRAALNTIIENTTNSDSERKAQIHRLRVERFSEKELIRVKALDRAAGIF